MQVWLTTCTGTWRWVWCRSCWLPLRSLWPTTTDTRNPRDNGLHPTRITTDCHPITQNEHNSDYDGLIIPSALFHPSLTISCFHLIFASIYTSSCNYSLYFVRILYQVEYYSCLYITATLRNRNRMHVCEIT